MEVQRTDIPVYENGAVHIGREFAGLTASRIRVEFEDVSVEDTIVQKFHCPACDFVAEEAASVQAHVRAEHPTLIETDN
jgi:hypothetical protein